MLEGQFECLRQNKEKCIAFLVPTKKRNWKIDKNGKEITKPIN